MGRRGSELKKARPDIYRYLDYRRFLDDQFKWLNQVEPRQFSLRKISEKSGLTRTLISFVLNGERNLTPSALKKLQPVLGLNASEVSFLKSLVALSDAPKPIDRKAALERIQTFPKYRKHHEQDREGFQYLQHWYTVAIHEMVELDDFRLDPEWIRERLNSRVPLSEVKNAIGFLFQNNYLEVNPEGQVVKKERFLDCTAGVYKIALETFHSQMYNLAIETISTTPRDERIIEGHTFSMSEDDIPAVKKIVMRTLEEITELTRSLNKNVNRVYHVSLAGFPVAREKDSENQGTES